MRSLYIGTEGFRDALNEWMKTYEPRVAELLKQNRNQIPDKLRSYTKTLYLATVVRDDFINNASTSKGRLTEYSFWTKDELVARRMSKQQRLQPGEYKIMISKTVPVRDQILDLDHFITFMGIPQLSMLGYDQQSMNSLQSYKGVLVANNQTITRSEYTILEQSTASHNNAR